MSNSTNSQDFSRIYDVIVLGAGISGLGAAKVLHKEGLKTLVLEARSRHGGRIHTVALQPVDSETHNKMIHVDLGANYLHGCANEQDSQPLFALAGRLGIPTSVCGADMDTPHRGWECPEVATWRDHLTGETIPPEDVAEMTFLLDRTLVKLLTKRRAYEDESQIDFAWLFDRSLNECLQNLHHAGVRAKPILTPREQGIFNSLYCRYIAYVNPAYRLSSRINFGSSYEKDADVNLSDDVHFPSPLVKATYLERLRHKINLMKTSGPQIEVSRRVHRRWEDRLVVEGFGRITDYLAEDLDIRYDTVVSQIDWTGVLSSRIKGIKENNFVELTTQTGETYRSRFCIVTLPVGVIRGLHPKSRVEFVPRLPDDKVEAIRKLAIPKAGAETHNKVILQFRPSEVFWERDTEQLECPDPRFHLLNLDYYGKPGVLMGHLWAGSGIQCQEKSDADIVAELMALMSGMYPEACPLPSPVHTIVTRWSEDPFSLGSYTAGEVGSSDADRLLYAGSLPSPEHARLLFAGEATVDSSGGQQCTHGAFLSGVHRARDIIFQFKGSCRVPDKRIVDYLFDHDPDLYPPHPMHRRGMQKPASLARSLKKRKRKSRLSWTKKSRTKSALTPMDILLRDVEASRLLARKASKLQSSPKVKPFQPVKEYPRHQMMRRSLSYQSQPSTVSSFDSTDLVSFNEGHSLLTYSSSMSSTSAISPEGNSLSSTPHSHSIEAGSSGPMTPVDEFSSDISNIPLSFDSSYLQDSDSKSPKPNMKQSKASSKLHNRHYAQIFSQSSLNSSDTAFDWYSNSKIV